MLYFILYVYDVSDNPKGFTKRFLNIPQVPVCYNLPASLFILRGIGNPLPCSCVFRWILVRIPPGRFLNLGKGFFPNRGELSIAPKATLVPRYIYGNISPGDVPYTLNY